MFRRFFVAGTRKAYQNDGLNRNIKMISFLFLLTSILILIAQIRFDQNANPLSPHILFQVYFIIQLPLNLFLGANFYMPRFMALSPLSTTQTILTLGGLITLSQAIFVICIYVLGARKRISNHVGKPWPKTRVNYIAAGMFGLGYAAFFGLIALNGGFEQFAATRELWRTSGISGQGWVLFPATTMLAIAMSAVLINNKEFFAGRTGLIKLAALFVITIIPASNLGFRGLIFLPLMQIVYFYHLYIRRIPGRLIAGGFIIVALVFTLQGIHREIPYSTTFGSYPEYIYDVYLSRPDIAYAVALRSMGADISLIVISHMDTFGEYVMFFPSLVEAATIYVPSALWPDKPLALSVQFSREILGINGGVSPTVVGEGYWHAGVVGVAVLGFIVAIFHTYFRRLQRDAPLNSNSALLMLSMYPSIIMMAEAFQGYFNGLVLILLANWLFRRLIA